MSSDDHKFSKKASPIPTGLLIVLLFPLCLAGQDGLDSLKSAALRSLEPAKQFRLLDSFVRKVYTVDVDTFIKYNDAFIKIALELSEYDAAVAASGRMAYSYNQYKNDKTAALRYIETIQPFEDSLQTSYSKGAIYSSLAGIYFNGDDYEKAIENYDKALERFGTEDSLFIADMFLFKGQAFVHTGQFQRSIENMQKAYRIYESQGDTTYMIEVMGELADIYSMNGLYEKAIAEYQMIDSLAARQNFIERLMINAYNSATTYGKMGKPAQQIAHLEKALAIFRTTRTQELRYQFTIWGAMITFYSKAQELEKAAPLLDSLENKEAYYLGSAYTHGLYLQPKIAYLLAGQQWKEARPFLEKYLDISEGWNDYDMRLRALEYASKLYQALGLHDNAREYLIAHYEMKDSIFRKSMQNQLLFYQTAFETERKEKLLQQQEASIQAMQKEQVSTRKIMLISITALAFLFGMLHFFRVRRQAEWDKQLQERFAMELIEQQEREKKRVSENLHDSLGQSLLLIKNQVILNGDEDSQKIVDQAITEVNSISKALHPLQLEQLGLTGAIRTNIRTLDQNSDIFFSAELEDIDHLFSKPKNLNIYRIVQEVLTNVVKHSRAKACRVELKKLRQQVLLTIQDNGTGFEFGPEYEKIGSLGLKTLKSRVRQLQGTVSFATQKGSGTIVKVAFPISHT